MNEENNSLSDFCTFKDLGEVTHLDGHANFVVPVVFEEKHGLRHKTCLVAGECLTK
jgi:hypothetical protein